MRLSAGNKLGPYEVIAVAGAGGMGEVYRARDSRLEREVALKVLPSRVVDDPAQMARFQHEARVLASLNHPNIAAIYGLEDSGESPALVMEFVDGPTLADRIARGPVPSNEALLIARQIAEAIEYAHEKGVTHRDLKPANVKLGADDSVKVLDFGLAKVLATETQQSDPANSPTFSIAATQVGMILGTAAYMSPEQAKGKAVDRRTDIWAFGCVLFEMLTGRAAFAGETVTDTLAAVVRGEPDWTSLPVNIPPKIVELLRRCLQKDVKQRLQAIGDARIAIDEALSAPQTVSLPLGHLEAGARNSSSVAAWIPWAALILVLLAGSLFWWRTKSPAPRRAQFEVPIAQSDSLQFEGQNPLAISPDGSKIAYTLRRNGVSQLYLRSLDSIEPVALPNTEGAFGPFFSPDGQWIGFFNPGKLVKIPAVGGSAIELCGTGGNPRGASWGSDGFIYLAVTATDGLVKVPENGGTPQRFTSLDAKNNERTHRWPSVLPDGKHILFTVGKMDSPEYYDDSEIDIADTKTGERSLIWKGASMATFVASGQLLYARGGTLYAVPFDLSSKKVTGASRAVITGVAGDISTGAAFMSLGSADIAIVEGGPMQTNRSNFAWVDDQGKLTALKAPAHYYRDMQLSPDGSKIAVVFAEKTQDVWIYDIKSDKLTRLTYEGVDQTPIWSPDGKTIFYDSLEASGGYTIKSVPADGSAAPVEIFSSDPPMTAPYSVSPDGATLFATRGTEMLGIQLKEKDHRVVKLAEDDKGWPRISPDGKLLTFVKGAGGYYELYVEPYPTTGAQWQISTDGGIQPVWSRDGKKVFFLDKSANVMMTEIQTSPTFSSTTPKLIYRNIYRPGGGTNNFSVAPDGKRILVLNPVEGKGELRIVMNLNWVQSLGSPSK